MVGNLQVGESTEERKSESLARENRRQRAEGQKDGERYFENRAPKG